MGASDSKLAFKQGVFKLYEQRDIPANADYWANVRLLVPQSSLSDGAFWELPESTEDIFSLLSSAEIRRIRDEAPNNLKTLIHTVTARLHSLRHHASFPHPEHAPDREALNCIRILTRLLPYVYEAEHMEDWEEDIFWNPRRRKSRGARTGENEVIFQGNDLDERRVTEGADGENLKPLGEELLDNLLDLLFMTHFTIPRTSDTKARVHLAIWHAGVGCNSSLDTTKELDSNRMEVLRLILTIVSKSMYVPGNVLPVQGVRSITYMATNPNRQLVMTLLCSLLNTTLTYNPVTWRVPYDHVVLRDTKQTLVTYCLQLLLALTVYPVPESSGGTSPKNFYRHYLGKVHRTQDFKLIVEGMTSVMRQPMSANTSFLPGSQKALTWTPEMIILFWEMLQCNKRFRSYIVDTEDALDFMIIVLFYAFKHQHDPSKNGVVRLCIFVLQTLSVEPSFGPSLNRAMQGHEGLPQVLKIPEFRGTHADFLIISIHRLITETHRKLDALYPALLAILNNIAPHACDLSSAASSRMMQLVTLMSNSDFIFANDSNQLLLRSLLEAVNAIVENQYDRNAPLVYAILRAHKRFASLQAMANNGAEHEIDKLALRRKEQAESNSISSGVHRGNESVHSPRASNLASISEQRDAFAIGGDDSDDEQDNTDDHTPSRTSFQSETNSRLGSSADGAEEVLPTQLRGMSQRARGKMPASHPPFSRQSSSANLNSPSLASPSPYGGFEPSVAWMSSWLPELPIDTPMRLIDQLMPKLPPQGPSSTSGAALNTIRRTPIEGLSSSPTRVHLFEWTPLSIGWYESLLWGFIFSTEIENSKGAMTLWKGTSVKLFRVQETAAQGPTLLAPRGAIDAVGSNLVQGISKLNLKRTPATPVAARNTSGGVVRDV
ncbi:MAG: hypothetical protein M1828_002038 [Chrysothrix sp. TS-e1954]|nr:MAG: hypothetical protein M1828_002038 [Chrysothrix sp. TS-e1954]